MVTDMYATRGNGLKREVEKFEEHKRAMFYILSHTPEGIDGGCAISEYVRGQRGSALYGAIEQAKIYLCDKFGMKLCTGHCGCNGHK